MVIERNTLPYNAMINAGKDVPHHVKPMIAVIIGKMDVDGVFDINNADRANGENFLKDAVATKDADNKNNINDVVNNYLDYDKEAPYTKDLGGMVHGLDKELDDIHDTDFEDAISDEDVVDSYDDFDIEALEKDADDKKEEDEDDDNDNNDDDNDSDDDDSEDDDDDKKDEPVEESTDVADEMTEANDDATIVTPTDTVEECGDNSCDIEQEGFLTKKPKKLKPIGRDVVAYITCEMNDIRSANDQAMLAGYTCSKIELVDFYLTVLDTQDARYIVPHNKTYLLTMKADLERLLAQILKIRPINRSEQIWRVNYPTT